MTLCRDCTCKSISIIIFCSCLIAFSVKKIGDFHSYYTDRRIRWKQAFVFLQSDNCVNPITRSSLGSFNLCDDSEKIVAKPAVMAAVYDLARDLYFEDAASMLYMDISANIHKILIVVVVMMFCVLYLMYRGFKQDRFEQKNIKYHLP